jgi:positive regulator of sigma E activity
VSARDEIIEYGSVIKSEKDIITVEISRPDACGHCAAKGACETFSGGGNHKARAKNICGAVIGDRVKIVVPTSGLLLSAFIIYFIPTAAIFSGAILGHQFHSSMGLTDDLASILGGLTLFAFSGLFIWLFSRGTRDKILPEAVEVLDLQENIPKSCST